MQKYYVMEVNDESAGEFPKNYNWDSPKSCSALRQFIEKNKDFPNFTPKLELEIYDDPNFNKINDFIFGPIDKFCVSEKVKNALEEFNLPKHKFYPVDIYVPTKIFGLLKIRKKISEKYFALNFDCFYISNNESWINYDKTKFEKDYLGLNQTEHIYFNNNFDTKLDLFEIRYSWMTYVSEELRNKLIEINATGLIFSEINERQYLVKRPNPKLTWE